MTDEQVGRHKGAVETLLHEKKELSRLLQIVNSQLERHLGALEEAGVDTDQFIEDLQQQQKTEQMQQGGQQAEQRSRQQSGQQRSQQSRKQGQQEEKVEGEDEIDEFLDEEEDDEVPDDFSPI